MWFEIIPAFVIIASAMAAPHGVAYVLNWMVLGNGYRRELLTYQQRLQYLRDRRLTCDAYKLAGLENLPDDECEEEEEIQEECDEAPADPTEEEPKIEAENKTENERKNEAETK